MSLSAPARILIPCQEHAHLEHVLRVAEPEEGCALVLGHRGERDVGEPDCWRVRWIWPCLNVWEPAQERSSRFAIDPREQLLAQKWSRLRRLMILGSAHSHPASAPVPSPTDRSLAFTPTLLVILGSGRELGCWWLPGPPGLPIRLPWTMEV